MLPYHDLLLSIFGHLSDDPVSLRQLTLASKHTYIAAIRILYKTVVLHQVPSIRLFCNTIANGPQNLRHLVQSLWIGPESHDRCPGIVTLVPQIRVMLKMLPSLGSLTLTPMAKSFGDIFYEMDMCSFKLDDLTVSYHTQHTFVQFLQSQPSITRLCLYDPDTEPPRAYNLVSNIKEVSARRPFLPNLKHISADPRVLAAVLIGRPVSHVEITVGSCLSNEPDEMKRLVAALTRTTVPITSMIHTLRTVRIHLWGNKFLQQLKETRIHSTLKRLTIHLPQIMRPVLLLRTSANIGPIAYISKLFSNQLQEFSDLECFELSLDGFRLSDPSVDEIAESFGNVGKLTTWKASCTTLKRVILYGIELE